MHLAPQAYAVLFIAGVAASILGSIVGLGGGFVVVPVMRIFFLAGPSVAAGTSLVYVLANVVGATIGYARQRLVDFKLGWTIAIGAIPASIAGVYVLRFFSPTGFDIAYGGLLVALGVVSIRQRDRLSDPDSVEKPFARSLPLAIGAGVLIGLASSIFGIGGGFVMVSVYLVLAGMKPRVISATSSFVVLLTAPFGIAAHAAAGHVSLDLSAPLVLGGLVGGTIGPQIAKRLSSRAIVTLLAVTLFASVALLVARHVFERN